MIETTTDVIDQLVGISPASPLHALRIQRIQARDNAQASFLALFHPADPGGVSLSERHALAVFIAGLQPNLATAIAAETKSGAAMGPYGNYPAGPLTPENTAGPTYAVTTANKATLGPRLSAALAHAHMLVFHPRDAEPAALQALLDAGWSTTDIVTISQLVAFLSFQIRVVTGLRTLAAA